MRNNIAALRHPTIQRKIRHAIWLAKLEAYRFKAEDKGTCASSWSGRQYVQNRKGHNIMRVDFRVSGWLSQSLTVWGDQSRNITNMVLQSLEQSK